MMEKKAWKASELQKLKEVEALQASVKRSNTLRGEITQRLGERNELEAEVADMGSQVRLSIARCNSATIFHYSY
jgi:hypothetical protein